MKALFVGFADSPISESVDATYSSLAKASPFGYDTIFIDPLWESMYGYSSANGRVILETVLRWKSHLKKWSAPHVKVIIMMRPYSENQIFIDRETINISNYQVIEGLIKGLNFVDCGTNKYIGAVKSHDRTVKDFILSNENRFNVCAYYKCSQNSNNTIHSEVSEGLATAFSVSSEDLEILFIPPVKPQHLFELVDSLGNNQNRWQSNGMLQIKEEIGAIEKQIDKLQSQRSLVLEKYKAASTLVGNLFEEDIYLARAVRAFEQAQQSENPNPERFYEAIEALESAFNSEREMREKLNVTKNFINIVMRRTNEFRHVSKDGSEPVPLTNEERVDFTHKINTLIANYIEYLLGNKTKR